MEIYIMKLMEIVDGNDYIVIKIWWRFQNDSQFANWGNLDEHGPFTDHLPEKAEFPLLWRITTGYCRGYIFVLELVILWFDDQNWLILFSGWLGRLEEPTSRLYTGIFAWRGFATDCEVKHVIIWEIFRWCW
jgi:hypothetical protein